MYQSHHISNKKAVALIAVLWAVVVMGTITLLLSRQSNLSLKINRNVMHSSQAMLLAEAGVHRAIAELVFDAENSTNDNQSEIWFDSQDSFYDQELGDGVYRLVHPDMETVNAQHYGIMDECSKLNINVVTKAQLMQLELMTEEIAEAIIDWRDEDSDQQPMGAEDAYYNGLTEPYNAKDGLYDSVEELLLVKGVTTGLLYGEDFNQNGALDTPENDGADHYPNDNSDGTLRRGWYPYLTVYSYAPNVDGEGESRINLNDASEDDLKEKFNGVLEENEIQSIVSARDENNFESIGDLFDVQLTAQNSGGGNNGELSSDKVKQILDQVTISGEDRLSGRINLNTASEIVIKTLFPDNPEVVTKITEARNQEGGIESFSDLFDINEFTEDLFKQVANQICLKSSTFKVRSIGYLPDTGSYKEVSALIDRGMDPPEIRYWKVIR